MGEAVTTFLPRSIGGARLGVKALAGQTRVAEWRHSGSLKILMPRTFRDDAEAVLVNTAGGMTGGDCFDISAFVGTGARLTMTSQAAERIYRARDDVPADVQTCLTVEAGARLHWVPQETILFDGAALNRRLQVDLAAGAEALVCETLVFGRALMGETVEQLNLRDRIDINRDGLPLYRDGIALTGDVPVQIGRAATLNGAGAVTQLIYIASDAATHLEAIRTTLPVTGAATCLAEDMLALRLAAPDSFELRKALMPVLDRLTGATLPGTWRM